MGLIEELYDASGGIEENVSIAIKAVNTAMKRDAASGEGVSVMLITQKGAQLLSSKEIKKYC
jgi:proteasome beta subunit